MKPSRKFLSSVIFFTMSSHLLHGAADVVISNQPNLDITGAPLFSDLTNNGGTSNLEAFTLTGALASSNVTVTTNTAAGSAPNGGQIKVQDSVTWNSSRTLSLVADTSTVLTATITNIGGGGVNINSGTTVAFDADMTLMGSPANLTVLSGGITQGDPNRKLLIGGLADLSGGAGNVTLTSANNFGSLKLTGAAVTVNENSSTLLTGVAASSLNLTTNGEITDSSGAVIAVSGLATLNAGTNAITLGDNGTDVTNFGSLNLTGTVINITEDSGTVLAGVTGATSFTLTSNGAITDTGNVSVSGLATLNSNGNDITLGDAGGEVTHFGSLNFNGAAVSISEDSAMNLAGVNSATSATLVANGTLTDTVATSVNITGLGSFSGSSLNLGAGSFNTGTLTFSSSGNVNITEDSDLVLVGDNTGLVTNLTAIGGGISDSGNSSINVGALTLSGTSFNLGVGASNTFNASTLNFNSSGSVAISENSDMNLVGINTAGSAALASSGALADAANSSLTVNGLGSFSGTSSVSLGVGSSNTFNTGSLNFVSNGNVTVEENSATEISGVNSAGTLLLNSSGAVTDQLASSLTVTSTATINAGIGASIVLDQTRFDVTGDTLLRADANQDIIVNHASNIFTGAVTFATTSGSLANVDIKDTTNFDLQALTVSNTLKAISDGALTDSGNLSVGGLATLGGSSILIGGSETTHFGSLNFNAANAVTIQEDSSTLLSGSSTAGTLSLSSFAGISNGNNASLNVTNNAIFNGTSITLGSMLGDSMNFGTLTFQSGGAVTIAEDSAMNLVGTNTGAATSLSSTSGISDASDSSVNVGALTLLGSSINLGVGGTNTFNASTLNFNSLGAVVISEDSTMDIVGSNTAGSATLSSTDALSDASNSSLTITGLGSFSGASINLGVGSGNTFNTGSLTFNSVGAVTISENSAMNLAGVNTGGVTSLTSTNSIADASDSSVTVGALTLNGTSINLGSGNLNTFNASTLNFNSVGAVSISEDSNMDIVGGNTADSATLASTGVLSDATNSSLVITNLGNFSGASIILGVGPDNTFNTGTLTFNSPGAVTISENSAMSLVGTNTGGVTSLTSTNSISDVSNSSVNVGALTLSGTSINLGSGDSNTFNASTLNFNSTGAVVISENSNMDIVGTNTAASAMLSSTGALSDAANSSLTITGLGNFSGTSINLGVGPDNVFNTGTLTFNSVGSVTVSENSAMNLVGTNTGGVTSLTSTDGISDASDSSVNVGALTLNGTSINLGVGATNTFNASTLNFNSAGAVTISENSAMNLVGINTGGVTSLTSVDGISDASDSSVNVGALTLNGTSINLGSGDSNTFNASTLNFNSTGAVGISENSNMDIVGTNTAASATLSSTGALSDAANSSLTITNLGNFSGTSISLGDGAGNTFNTGTLTFNSTGAVTVSENSAMNLVGVNTGGVTRLTSTDSISDATDSSVNVGALTLNGTSINLGSGDSNAFNASTLNFNSAGAVTVSENSSMDIVGTNTADSATLSSTAALSDAADSSLTITGLANLSGSSISLGDGSGNTFNAGSLTFNSLGAVTISENSSMTVVGTNTAGALGLTSSGEITDNANTSITVTGNSAMIATNAITLNNSASDVLSVSGNAAFSGSAITLGFEGLGNFGSLTFNSAGAVTIQEDSSTALNGISTAGSLGLTSSGEITDNTGTSLTVTGDSLITASNGITLNNSATDVLSVSGNAAFSGSTISLGFEGLGNFGSLTFNSAGAVTIQEDSATLLNGLNTAASLGLTSSGEITDNANTSLTVTGDSSMIATNAIVLNNSASDILSIAGNAAFSGSAITLGSAGTADFGSLTFNAAGAVTVQEDSSTLLTGVNTANGLGLTSSGEITDNAGISLTVTGNSLMTATNAIALNNSATDVLSVSGNAAFSGSSISLGFEGIGNFGSLTFNSGGAVTVQEDSSTALNGVNTAASLGLTSSGEITDNANTSLTVTGDSSMTATNGITLNDSAGDVLSVTGNAAFSGSTIALGSAGAANFGSLTFNSAGSVTVQEDSATVLSGINTAGGLGLTSSGEITDNANTSLTVTGNSSMTATTGITLSDSVGDVLNVTGNAAFSGSSIMLGSSGTSNFDSLTFNSGGAVTIQEDSATALSGVNTANSLGLTSSGAITDNIGTSLTVTGNSSMTSTHAITLNDSVGDLLSIGGNAAFNGLSIMLGSLGTANFDSLTFNSVGAVTIQEDSSTALSGINTANSLSLTSSGAITDLAGTSLTVTGGSSWIATQAITLNDSLGDVLSIGGNADFSGSAITLGSLGTANFESLTFNSLGTVTIQEDSATALSGINTANSLSLTSAGAITDNASTSLTVTGGSSMTATQAITLNDNLGDLLSIGANAAFSGSAITIGSLGSANFGSLTFNSSGAVSIHEDSSMQILGVNTGGSTTLNSTAGISDVGATSINTADLTVSGTSINLGNGEFNATTLNFNSEGQVTIAEDSSMDIVGVNTANSATLSSTGALSDAGDSSLTISGLGTLSGASIDLGVGSENTFNSGTLNFNSAGAVTIDEDSNMDIVGVNTAASATLSSEGVLSDGGATSIGITGLGEFSGTSINLGGGLFNTGTLTFDSEGAVTIHEDSSTSLTGSSTASSLYLTSTAGITNEAMTSLTVSNLANLAGASITLGTLGGDTIHFGTLAFNSVGAVTIVEDSSTMLSGTSTAGSLALTSGGALTDSGNLTVTGLASLSGSSIMIGGAALTTHFGSLTVNSPGSVEVQEDSDTQFVGTNTASTLTLRSNGVTTFATGSSLDAATLDVKKQSVVLTGNNLVDTIEVKLADDTTLIVNGNETIRQLTSDGGTLAGPATLTATGGATLNGTSVVSGNLLGNTTSTGDVLLSGTMGGGTLSVTGGILTLTGTATANTTVSEGATLKGAGFIVGDLTNYGTTALSLTISGSLVTKGFVTMSFNSPLDFDRIKAASADLDGGLIVTNTGTGLANGQTAKIIDAGIYTGAFTAFSSVDFDNGLLFNDKTGMLIGLAGGEAHPGGRDLNLPDNQPEPSLGLFENAVETGVKNVSRAGDVITFTSGASNGDDQLVTALNESTFGTPGVIDANIVNRLSPEVFAGMADYTEQALLTHVRQAFDTAPSVREGKTEVFATLHSSTAGVDDSTNQAAYDIEFAGVTTGMRYDVNQNFQVGGLLGVDDGSITGTLIDADGQGLTLGGFGSYQFKDKFQTMLLGSLTYGNYTYDTTRQSYGGEASADGIGSGAIELALGVSAVVYEKDNLRISPTGGFRLMSGSVDSFEEDGAGVPLAADEQDIESFLFEVGVDFSYQVQERFSVVGRLGYIQNLSDSDQEVTATFANAGPGADSFTVTAPGIDNQGVTVGLGLYYDMTETARMGLTFNSEFGSDSLPTQTFGLGLSYGF